MSGEAVDAVRRAFAALRGPGPGPRPAGGGGRSSEPLDPAVAGGAGAAVPRRAEIVELLAGVRRRFGPDLGDALHLGATVLDEASFDDLVDQAEALLVAELEAGD